LEEEYQNLKNYREGSKQQILSKVPHEALFNEFLDKYSTKGNIRLVNKSLEYYKKAE
jgi:hypothetical protein